MYYVPSILLAERVDCNGKKEGDYVVMYIAQSDEDTGHLLCRHLGTATAADLSKGIYIPLESGEPVDVISEDAGE